MPFEHELKVENDNLKMEIEKLKLENNNLTIELKKYYTLFSSLFPFYSLQYLLFIPIWKHLQSFIIINTKQSPKLLLNNMKIIDNIDNNWADDINWIELGNSLHQETHCFVCPEPFL